MIVDSTIAALGLGLAAVLGLMTAVWLASLVRRDAGIIDPFWGLGFVLLAWLHLAASPARTARAVLVAVLVSVWGLRLSIHLFLRSRGKAEDPRYRAMRERHPEAFPRTSLVTVFWLQAGILWFVALPLVQAIRAAIPVELGRLDLAGVAVWAVGLFFETVGDWQLSRFKADPRNQGKVCDRGLWRYTRHPNYFGDSLVWWGLTLIALATPRSLWTMASPAVMTFLLVKVSGVALLEKGLEGTKPEYRAYVRRTSSFFPLPPRKSGPT